jgi:thymidylate kinase
MRQHHYRRAVGGWNRVTHVGLERIRAVSPSQLALSSPAWEDMRLSSSPMPGRAYCRRASAGTSLLVTAMAVSVGKVDRGTAGQLGAASSQAWAEAERLATKHGLLSQLKLLTQTRGLDESRRAGGSGPVGLRKPRAKPVRVSFSGLDGAGKTRQIDALVAEVGEHHSVSRLGPKRTTAVSDPPVCRTRGEQTRPTQIMPTTRGRDSFADGLRSAMWVGIGTFAAVSVGLSLRRRALNSSADVLVLDRYRLDSLVKLQFRYSEVSEAWLARVVGALAPAPDVEFLLRVDPAVAFARKPEQWSVDQLSRQARLYDLLAAGPLHVVTLDAHEDADDIAREVSSHVRAFLDGC